MPGLVIAIIGLGYVGLPFALAFGRMYSTIGYDLSSEKLARYAHKAVMVRYHPEIILAGRDAAYWRP